VAFGSIGHPEVFHLRSDIDIAVDGIPWPAYLRAWNDVEETFPEFKVDLIDVGIVSPVMLEAIEREGRELGSGYSLVVKGNLSADRYRISGYRIR
jgi:hypothetical protein